MARRPSWTLASRSPLGTTETLLPNLLLTWGMRHDWPPTSLLSTTSPAKTHELRFTSSRPLPKQAQDHIVRYIKQRVPEASHAAVAVHFKAQNQGAAAASSEDAVDEDDPAAAVPPQQSPVRRPSVAANGPGGVRRTSTIGPGGTGAFTGGEDEGTVVFKTLAEWEITTEEYGAETYGGSQSGSEEEGVEDEDEEEVVGDGDGYDEKTKRQNGKKAEAD